MGDVIMSTPALSALKESFNCKITLLTSKMGAPILPHISDIDDSMVANLPWVKATDSLNAGKCTRLIHEIKKKNLMRQLYLPYTAKTLFLPLCFVFLQRYR